MNSKDYKEISRIIDRFFSADYYPTVKKIQREVLTKKLADYFEKDNKERLKKGERIGVFVKEQFLKDCGVD